MVSGIHLRSSGFHRTCTAPPLGLYQSQHSQLIPQAQAGAATAVAVLGVVPSTGIPKMLESSLQLGCAFTSSFSWALFRDSSPGTWCQASTCPHGSFSPEASIATEAEPSPAGSPRLLWCQVSAALHDLFMPSKPASPGRLSQDSSSCLLIPHSAASRPAWDAALAPSGP